MKKVSEYLDIAKEKSGSDYRTAKEIGMTRAGVSAARKRNIISNENAEKLARLIDVNPAEIIAASEIQIRPESKDVWMRWIAASVILSVGIIGFSANESMAYAGFDNLSLYTLCAFWGVGILLVFGFSCLLKYRE